jgi:hypothetical protein
MDPATPRARGGAGRGAWRDAPGSLGSHSTVVQACAGSCAHDVLSTRPGCQYSGFFRLTDSTRCPRPCARMASGSSSALSPPSTRRSPRVGGACGQCRGLPGGCGTPAAAVRGMEGQGHAAALPAWRVVRCRVRQTLQQAVAEGAYRVSSAWERRHCAHRADSPGYISAVIREKLRQRAWHKT